MDLRRDGRAEMVTPRWLRRDGHAEMSGSANKETARSQSTPRVLCYAHTSQCSVDLKRLGKLPRDSDTGSRCCTRAVERA